MIELVLPAGVAAVERREALPADELAGPQPEALERALPRRRAEFATGRSCARRALAVAGAPACPVPRGAGCEPCWPAGFVGSITHCAGYWAAAVARTTSFATIGIDAETAAALPAGVLDRIAVAEEVRWVRARDGDGMCWDRLLFSVKESVYKAWSPLGGERLRHRHASVRFAPEAGVFEARLLVAGPRVGPVAIASFAGRFAVRDGVAVTAVAVPAA
jgi:4'-phosphopantetheinyl transferase EntD